jgi:hypothetical protein
LRAVGDLIRQPRLEEAALIDFVTKKRRSGNLPNPFEDIRKSAVVPEVGNKIGGRIEQAGRYDSSWKKSFAYCRLAHLVVDPSDYIAHPGLSIAERNARRHRDPLKAEKIAPVFDEYKTFPERRGVIRSDRDDRRDEGKRAFDAEKADEIHFMLSQRRRRPTWS